MLSRHLTSLVIGTSGSGDGLGWPPVVEHNTSATTVAKPINAGKQAEMAGKLS